MVTRTLARRAVLTPQGAFGANYLARVLATNPISIRPLNEGSGSIIYDKSGNGYNGTYTGVTWEGTVPPMGGQAPRWDGALDYGNVYSAGFGSAFDFDEFTIMLWLKMSSGAVWSDGVFRTALSFYRNGSNQINLWKESGSAKIGFQRVGDGTSKVTTSGNLSYTDWFSIAISVSIGGGGLLNAGDLRAYINGVQVGSTITGNIAAVGSGLNSARVLLGAANQTPENVHDGYEAWEIVYDRALDNDILALGTV